MRPRASCYVCGNNGQLPGVPEQRKRAAKGHAHDSGCSSSSVVKGKENTARTSASVNERRLCPKASLLAPPPQAPAGKAPPPSGPAGLIRPLRGPAGSASSPRIHPNRQQAPAPWPGVPAPPDGAPRPTAVSSPTPCSAVRRHARSRQSSSSTSLSFSSRNLPSLTAISTGFCTLTTPNRFSLPPSQHPHMSRRRLVTFRIAQTAAQPPAPFPPGSIRAPARAFPGRDTAP